MRKERDWPVPGRGRQSSVSSISRCLLASGTSSRSGCLWGGCGSEPHVTGGQWGNPSLEFILVGIRWEMGKGEAGQVGGGRQVRREEDKWGEEPGWGGATAQNANRKEERNK